MATGTVGQMLAIVAQWRRLAALYAELSAAHAAVGEYDIARMLAEYVGHSERNAAGIEGLVQQACNSPFVHLEVPSFGGPDMP